MTTDHPGDAIHNLELHGLTPPRMVEFTTSLEDALIISLAHPLLSEAQLSVISSTLTDHGALIDWSQFLAKSASLAVLPLIAQNISANRLGFDDKGRTTIPFRWIYSCILTGNAARNTALQLSLVELVTTLADVDVRSYAVRKGLPLAASLYGARPGARRIGDTDLLVGEPDLLAIVEVLRNLGYEQGQRTTDKTTVVPFDRSTRLYWKVNLPNIRLPFIRVSDDDLVDLYVVDLAVDLFQPRSGSAKLGESFIERRQIVDFGGTRLPTLSGIDQVVDSAAQLFQEATSRYYIKLGKDLTLQKFLEFGELVGRHVSTGASRQALVSRCTEANIVPMLAFATFLTLEVYPSASLKDLSRVLEDPGTEFLDTYGEMDGDVGRWREPLLVRIFDRARGDKVSINREIPGPRAVV